LTTWLSFAYYAGRVVRLHALSATNPQNQTNFSIRASRLECGGFTLSALREWLAVLTVIVGAELYQRLLVTTCATEGRCNLIRMNTYKTVSKQRTSTPVE